MTYRQPLTIRQLEDLLRRVLKGADHGIDTDALSRSVTRRHGRRWGRPH